MASQEKTLHWDKEKGSIFLTHRDRKHRLFLMRKGFMGSFFEEILNMEGKDTLSMTVRKILEKAQAKTETAKPTVDTLNRFKDDLLLPISIGPDELPTMFTRTEGTRELVAFGSVSYLIEIAATLNILKEVSMDILTPRGARAIIRTVAKRAGMAVGNSAKANYSWNEIEAATGSLGQLIPVIFPLMGWGNTSVSAKKGANGSYLFFIRCANTFESDGVSSPEPVCIVFASLLEGLFESIVLTLTGQAAECREVRCAATGGDTCAFAIKLKAKGSPALDWSAIEGEWKALDK